MKSECRSLRHTGKTAFGRLFNGDGGIVSVVALAMFALTGATAFGENVVPSVGNFSTVHEASLADPKLWSGYKLPIATTNNTYLYVGDTFRYFLDGSDTTLTNFVELGSVSFSDRSWTAPVTAQHLTLDVAGDATLKTGEFTISRTIDGTQPESADASTHYLCVRDGGSLETSLFKVPYADAKIEILSGGTLVTTNIAYIGSASVSHEQSYPDSTKRALDDTLNLSFLISNATWRAHGCYMGRYSNHENTTINFHTTNAVIENAGWSFRFEDDSDYVFGPGTRFLTANSVCIDSGARVTFDGASSPVTDDFPNEAWWIGSGVGQNRETVLTLKGDTEIRPRALITSNGATETNRIVIAGNAWLRLDPITGWYEYLRPSLNGVSTIELRDNGKFSLETQNYGLPLRLGINATAKGTLKVSGGSLLFYAYGIWVGVAGTGEMEVSGGEVRTARLLLGYNASETATASFRQTGGLVCLRREDGTVTSEMGFLTVAEAAHPSTVSLEGGVLECAYVTSKNPSYATVVANGGTIRRVGTYYGPIPDKTLIRGIGSFTVGAKGLTLDIVSGDTATVRQSMTSVAGEAGLLRKTGEGSLALADATYDVATVEVADGSLVLQSGAAFGGATSLVVTNGATFSLVGSATSATVKDLVVTNGFIAIDPGDKIVVSGAVALERVKVTFSSLPAVDAEADFLDCAGELDAASLKALSRAIFTNPLADGTHGALTASYDATTGRTTVKIAVKTNVPLAAETSWTGSGAWGTDANWSAGVPTASTVAAFAAADTATEVSVNADATAGALRFANRDFTLTGSGTLAMPSEEGALAITVESGTQTVNVALSQNAPMRLAVASDAAVSLTKSIDGAGFVKSGRGKAVLSAANAFYGAVSLNGGTTAVAIPDALGAVSNEAENIVNLGDATLAFSEGDGTEISCGHQFVLNTASANNATIVRTDRDVVFEKAITPATGVIVKRGKGRLTLKVRDGDILTNSDGNGKFGSDSGKTAFYEDGTPSNRLCAAITVAEGSLLVKPAVAGTHPTVTMKNTLASGIKVKRISDAQPEFAFEDVAVDMTGKDFWLSHGCNEDDEYRYPALRLVNAEMTLSRLVIGTWSYAKNGGPTLALTNATVTASSLELTSSNGSNSPVRLRAKDSALVGSNDGNSVYVHGAMEADFDHSSLGWASGKCGVMKGGDQYTGAQTWTFRNGSEMAIGSFSNLLGNDNKRTFRFENSTWNVGDNDLTLDATITKTDRFNVVSAGATGLVLRVSADSTMTFAEVPLTGDGGLTVTGGGTVAFGDGMVRFTGAMRAAEGVLDLSEAGVVSNVTIVAGAGTIKGATFRNVTIALTAQGGSVPAFENCSFAGKTVVSVAGDLDKASGVVIATYSGTCTGIDTFKFAKRSDSDLTGRNFRTVDGTVAMDVVRKGNMAIFIR